MTLDFTPLHLSFVAAVRDLDLRRVADQPTLAAIRAGMERYGVLVFRGQPFSDAEQLAFAQRFDGELHAKTGTAALGANRFGNEALTDISNVDEHGAVLPANDRRRQYGLANRLWHTDASFENPPGRFSLLSARVLPPTSADTEFADMAAAWDALPDSLKAQIDGLTVHHSIAYSRQMLGFDFSAAELDKLQGAIHPLVRRNPTTGRRSLYLASHASRIVEWSLPEGKLMLRELIEHATQPQFVYRHRWAEHDLVIWDNRATMHRARPFEDLKYQRELRRVTTLDIL